MKTIVERPILLFIVGIAAIPTRAYPSDINKPKVTTNIRRVGSLRGIL
jgi:hypothetical protein